MHPEIIDGFLTGIKQVVSPYFNDRPTGELPILLVIHNISLPPNQYGGPHVEQLFTGTLNPDEHPYFATIAYLEVSSHFFIRRTGELIQFVSCDKRAWHAGVSNYHGRTNCNDFSIGIELEGCDTESFTDIQYQVLAKLTKQLYLFYPIIDIVGHSDIAPGRKTDPGPYFDWNRYKILINFNQEESMLEQHLPVLQLLNDIESEMRKTSLWQTSAPEPSAFESVEPFCIDRMHANEWLQWIFLPRMKALIDMQAELPINFSLHPYFEEAFKEQDKHINLLKLIKQLDDISQR